MIIAVRQIAFLAEVMMAMAVVRLEPAWADDSSAREYLIEKICVGRDGVTLPTDPYRCESPNRLRDAEVGERLPYHKVDQDNSQWHDSYPAKTPDGWEIVVNPFDQKPFGSAQPGEGYDIYVIREGWASANDTKDGGGFGQTFFTEGCKPYNGWVLFPTSSVSAAGFSPGQVNAAIAVSYWEQDGVSWPGKCPADYQKETLTTWDFIHQFEFGGTDAVSIKSIDTIRSVHGFHPVAGFFQHGHLEVFYFTRLYGVSRWEVWVPAGQTRQASKTACSGPGEMNYQGSQFKRTDCRDWTQITPSTASEPNQYWPVPGLNLLKNFHFGAGVDGWSRMGDRTNWSLKNSTVNRDYQFHAPGSLGLRYLALNCDDKSGNSRIYQDVPITFRTTSGIYTLAATVRTEAGQGAIAIGVEQLDKSSRVLATARFEATVEERNPRFTSSVSELLASEYVASDVSVTVEPGAVVFRFYVAPKDNSTFDITDVWFMKRK